MTGFFQYLARYVASRLLYDAIRATLRRVRIRRRDEPLPVLLMTDRLDEIEHPPLRRTFDGNV